MFGKNKAKDLPNSTWYAIAVARVLLGFVFFWSFLDKLFGFGYATPSSKAWIHGASPTKGVLMNIQGPFAGFFHSIAGHAWVDWLFMIGLAALGVALILGILVRFATAAGTILLLLIWAASLPVPNNPFVDEHIIYIAMLWIINLSYADQVLSVAPWWRGTRLGRGSWLW